MVESFMRFCKEFLLCIRPRATRATRATGGATGKREVPGWLKLKPNS